MTHRIHDLRITSVRTELLQIPLSRPIVSGSASAGRGGRLDTIFFLAAWVATDHGPEGFGFAYFLQGGGKAAKVLIEQDLAPGLIGEDPLDHDALWQKLYWRLQSVGRRGLVMQAQSALDLALWDLKGKVAGLPLWMLLRGSVRESDDSVARREPDAPHSPEKTPNRACLSGARESAPVYGSDGGWLWMSVEQMVEAAHEYLARGMIGTKLKVGHDDPREDIRRVDAMRKALGDGVWLAVDANQRWDYARAIEAGREFERLRCAWFEEPMSCEDPAGHARLADALDIPIALGETLQSRFEIQDYIERGAVDIVQPDLTRVGGLTEFLKVAAIAEERHLPVWPHLMMEVSIHLACGLTGVAGLEYMPWLTPALAESPRIEHGRMVAPNKPGLGLEINQATVERFHVE